MCLLIVVARPGTAWPLVVGANRDERLDRPAVPITVLADRRPRILGGRDLLAGGTWLAVNEYGVVAGLTNAPAPGGRDPSKRSRGGLALLAAGAQSAGAGVDVLTGTIRPADYNPAWLLVGDRSSLYAVTIAGERPAVVELGPGVHVLENRPPGSPSPKTTHVLGLLAAAGIPSAGGDDVDPADPDDLMHRLAGVLGDHSLPAPTTPRMLADESSGRDPRVEAACVHTDSYGTRSSAIIAVPAVNGGWPRVKVAAGPPCTTPFGDFTAMWGGPAPVSTPGPGPAPG